MDSPPEKTPGFSEKPEKERKPEKTKKPASDSPDPSDNESFTDVEMQNFIVEDDEQSSSEDSSTRKRPRAETAIIDDLAQEDLDLAADKDGQKVAAETIENSAPVEEKRIIKKLKKLVPGVIPAEKSKRSGLKIPAEKSPKMKKPKAIEEEDFIEDDTKQVAGKDDYTLEIEGPTHTSEAMNLVTSIFGQVSDFFSGKAPLLPKEDKIASVWPKKAAVRAKIDDLPSRLSHCHSEENGAGLDDFKSESYIQKEAFYLTKRLAREQIISECSETSQKAVSEIISLFHRNHYDVPYIINYRRESWAKSELTAECLWRLLNYDAIYTRWQPRLKAVTEKARARLDLINFIDKHVEFAYGDADLIDLIVHLKFNAGCEGISSANGSQSLRSKLGLSFDSDAPNSQSELTGSQKRDGKKRRKVNSVFVFSNAEIAFINLIGTSVSLWKAVEGLILNDALFENGKAAKPGKSGKNGGNGPVKPENRADPRQNRENEAENDGKAAVEGEIKEISKPVNSDTDENEENFEMLLEDCIGDGKRFAEKEKMVDFAVDFLAKELSSNPFVRKLSRKAFMQKAVVCTEPTIKGKLGIDWTHPFLPVKRIVDKPLRVFLKEFCDNKKNKILEQYALLNDAEKKGFIMAKFKFEKGAEETTPSGGLESLLKSIYPQTNSHLIKSLRFRVIEIALESYLTPMCEQYAREILLQKSNDFIASDCARNLRESWLNINGIASNGKPVFALSIGEENEPSFCAILTPAGVLADYAKFKFLKFSRKSTSDEKSSEEKRKSADLDKLKNLISEHGAELLVMGATCIGCDSVLDDVESVCSTGGKGVRCELVRSDVAKIFQHSKRSEVEFSEYPPGLRKAISLARFALSPLDEICYMALGTLNDILSLHLSETQKLVPRELLLERLIETIARSVNAQGVFLNEKSNSMHKKNTLEFVSGFGPKIVRFLAGNPDTVGIQSRDKLKEILNDYPKIFQNCAGFLRFEARDKAFCVLDSTRITPELYPLAKKAFSAVLKSQNDGNMKKLAKDAFSKKKLFESFDWDEFKHSLSAEEGNVFYLSEGEGVGDKVDLIVREIVNPYSVSEFKEFPKMSNEELFWAVVCESRRYFRPGQELAATVLAFTYTGAVCNVNSNVIGQLPAENAPERPGISHGIDDENKIQAMRKVLSVGMTIPVKISEFCMDRGNFYVVLDARKEVLNDNGNQDPALVYHPRNLDKYLDLETDRNFTESDGEKEADAPTFVSRKIDFPFFKNMSRAETEKHLAEKDVGSLVIRPSSRGTSFLTATWKVSNDPFIAVHFEIKEKNKANSFSIGRSLEINKMKFEDLDEIYARFFEKMTSRMKEITAFRKFRFGTEDEVQKLVVFDKNENPDSVPYAIGFSQKHPGCLVLFYVFSRNVKKEYVVVVPNGFRFREKTFKTAEKLVQWFKTHPFQNSPYLPTPSGAPGDARGYEDEPFPPGYGYGGDGGYHGSYDPYGQAFDRPKYLPPTPGPSPHYGYGPSPGPSPRYGYGQSPGGVRGGRPGEFGWKDGSYVRLDGRRRG